MTGTPPTDRRWTGDAMLAVVLRVGSIAVKLWTLRTIARALDKPSFALFVLAGAVIVVVSAVADLGLDRVLLRSASQGRSTALGSSVRLRMGGWMALLPVGAVAAWAVGDGRAVMALLLLAPGGAAAAVTALTSAWLMGAGRAVRAGWAELLGASTCLALVSMSSLAPASPRLLWMCASFSAGQVVTAGILLRRAGSALIEDGQHARALLREGRPFHAMIVMNALYLRFDQFWIGRVLPPSALADYGLAYRVFEALQMVPGTFATVLTPRLHSDDHRRRAIAIYATVAIGWFTSVVGVLVLVPGVMGFVIDRRYGETGGLISVLALAGVASAVNALLGQLLLLRGLERRIVSVVPGIVAFNMVMTVVLVASVGVVGAAWAMVASEAAAAATSGWLLHASSRRDAARPVDLVPAGSLR